MYIIIISQLKSPLLGHRPFLWITHKENGPLHTTWAQCGLVVFMYRRLLAENRARWRGIGEAYVQQWTEVG
jgi:hypothetical protein